MAIVIAILATAAVGLGIAVLAGCVVAGRADDMAESMRPPSDRSEHRKAA